jgi:hypothetical protein
MTERRATENENRSGQRREQTLAINMNAAPVGEGRVTGTRGDELDRDASLLERNSTIRANY